MMARYLLEILSPEDDFNGFIIREPPKEYPFHSFLIHSPLGRSESFVITHESPSPYSSWARESTPLDVSQIGSETAHLAYRHAKTFCEEQGLDYEDKVTQRDLEQLTHSLLELTSPRTSPSTEEKGSLAGPIGCTLDQKYPRRRGI